MKAANMLFFFPSLVLLVAWGMKLNDIPNHLIVVATALLLMFIFLVVFLSKAIQQTAGVGKKLVHVFFFLLIFFVLVLPFAGVFHQGLIPIVIYGIMVASVILYFQKTNRDSTKKLLIPASYRNFVFQNLLLMSINSPFIEVLPDRFYSPAINPVYEEGKGPEIYIDENHNNYHTSSGLYTTFSNLLRKDGYVVKPFSKTFSGKSLEPLCMLVISNALNRKNIGTWEQPVYPAFDEREIQSLKAWVETGGSLFLIADHPPFSSASKTLGAAFGFSFSDKTAEQRARSGHDLFCRKNGMLLENEITNGNNSSEYVDSIVTFTGQAFSIPAGATSILNFTSAYADYVSEGDKKSVPEDITGLSQGAYMKVGKGKIVVFGEAAMFSGQLGAGLSWFKIGMNSPVAGNNYKLLLNIVHWLDNK